MHRPCKKLKGKKERQRRQRVVSPAATPQTTLAGKDIMRGTEGRRAVKRCCSAKGTFHASERKDFAREFSRAAAEIDYIAVAGAVLDGSASTASEYFSLDCSQRLGGITWSMVQKATEYSNVATTVRRAPAS